MATGVDTLIVNTLNATHIRKGKKVGVFVAPSTVAIPAAFTTGGAVGPPAVPITLSELPGFLPIGLLRKDDGVPMSRNRDQSDVTAIGYNDPVRSDVTSDVFTAKIVALETRKTTIEQYLNVDLSTVTSDPVSGEVRFPQPTDIALTRSRWLFIGQDGIGTDRIWWGRLFPAGIVSEVDDQNLASADDPWTWPMTIQSQTDTTLGYSVLHFFGGPGFKSRLTSMGLT